MKLSPMEKAMRSSLVFLLILLLLICISHVFSSFETAMANSIRFQTIITVLFVFPLATALWQWSAVIRQNKKPWKGLFLPIRLVSISLGLLMIIQIFVTFRG